MAVARRVLERVTGGRRGAPSGSGGDGAGLMASSDDWRDATILRGRARYRPVFVAGAFFFVAYPLIALFHSTRPPEEIALALAGWALFVIAILIPRPRPFAQTYSGPLPLVLVILIASIGVVLVLRDRGSAFTLLFYYAAVAAIRLTPERLAVAVLGSTAVVAGVTTGYAVGDLGSGASVGFGVGLISLTVFSMAALTRAYADLHAARHELATLAVAEERNRIARDLHDTLGHSLSVVALKTDLAARLLPPAPEFDRVRSELADAQGVAREALNSVRETIGGYRKPTLEGELAGAHRRSRPPG